MTEKRSQLSEIAQYIIDLIEATDPKTVERLIDQVQIKYPLPKNEILDHVINLQNQGKIALKKSAASAPSSLGNYILSKHSYWYWAITVLSTITTLLVFIISKNTYPLVYIRYVLGAIFVLWLPGYSFIKVLFPTKEIDNIERIALNIGVSLVLVPITGLFLNYTPWGIRLIPITLSLLVLTLILATAALLREYQVKTKTQ